MTIGKAICLTFVGCFTIAAATYLTIMGQGEMGTFLVVIVALVAILI